MNLTVKSIGLNTARNEKFVRYRNSEVLKVFMNSVRRPTRKQILEVLKSAEGQFVEVFGASPLVVTITRAKDDRYIEVNETFERMTGWRRDEVLGRTPYDLGILVDPGQRADLVKRLLSGATARNVDVRVRMRNGDKRTGLGSLELIELEGEPCVLSVAVHVTDSIDVTGRMLAEDALSKVIQGLIETQEEERASIARELHRYIDALAVLAISLGRGQNPPASLTKAWETIGNARQQVEDIVSDVWTLLHTLHSAKLDYLGLAAATAGFCKELSERQNVKIDFHCESIPKELPKNIALCLYRVLQEALQNATKHSGSRVLEVSLHGEPNEIQLTVRDWGVGFDPTMAVNGPGLGLVSMNERLKLFGGKLSIESQTKQGATIHARVPLKT
jgi:PAS domain S-box-containing protein